MNNLEGHLAQLMDGKSADVTAVRIILGPTELVIVEAVAGERLDGWPLKDLRVEVLPDGRAVEVRHPGWPDAMLMSMGDGLTEALRGAGVRVHGLPRGGHLRNLLIANALGVIVLVAGGYLALPYIAGALAKHVPMTLEKSMGDQIDLLLDGSYCESASGQQALLALQRRIEGPAAPPRELRILNMAVPNAFTFPGGRIVMTKGLMSEAESADELAGILAHEIQHVKQRHIMTHVIRGTILSAAWAATAGDFTGIMVIDPTTAFQIANLRFSRADEESADRGAVAMLDAVTISRDGMVKFFDRLKEKSDVVPQWLSTHPSSARRARELAGPGPVTTGKGEPVLSPAHWNDLKKACDSTPDDNRSLRQILFGR